MIINFSVLPALAAVTSKASLSCLAAHIVISRGTLTRSLGNHLHFHPLSSLSSTSSPPVIVIVIVASIIITTAAIITTT